MNEREMVISNNLACFPLDRIMDNYRTILENKLLVYFISQQEVWSKLQQKLVNLVI